MKLSNNKGFSLVELLAVISIIGVLSVLAVVSVQGVLSRSRDEYYKSQKQDMEMAARSYVENNKSLTPKISGQIRDIKLSELQNNKFISKVVDANKKACDYEKSFVRVYKYEDNLIYTSYLECPGYNKDKIDGVSSLDVSFTYSEKADLQNAKATIKVFDTGDASKKEKGVVAYQYKIYADDKLVYTSEMYNVKKKLEVKKDISLKDYVPAKIKIEVSATGVNGFNLVKSSTTSDFIDKDNDKNNSLVCGEITNDSTTWQKDNRIVSIKCSDTKGSGCQRDVFTKEFRVSTKVGKILIKDKAGNSKPCDVNVYVDKTVPTVTVKVYKRGTDNNKLNNTVMNQITADQSGSTKNLIISKGAVNGWLNKSKYPNGVYFEVSYDDGTDGSGVKEIEWKWNNSNLKENDSNARNFPSGNVDIKNPNNTKGTYGYSISGEGWRYGTITVKDVVGNTTKINITAPLDRTSPTCTKSGESTTWTSSDRYITINCHDSMSGCSTNFGRQRISTTTRSKNYTLQDYAGNSSTCGVNAYVDKDAPSCGSITGASTSWTASDRNIRVSCSDSHSGCSQSSFSKTFNTSTKQGTIQIRDNVGNARNCSVNAYVDKTPPTCGSNNGSTSWTNSSRTISVNCSDSQSGCSKSSFSQYFSSNTKTSSITIRDNVGHTTTCPVNVYIDKTSPTCGYNNGSTSWTNSNRTVTVNCNDSGGSGCSSVSKTFSSTTKTSNITLRDGAGNSVSCGVNVYVDKTPPSCNGSSGTSTTWTRSDRNISVGCVDSDSGCKQGSFSKYYNYTKKTDNITIYDWAGNSRNCGVNVYVDKTPPYTPVTSFESGNDHTSVDNDSCTWHFDNNWKSHSSISCSYRINFPRGKTFYLWTSTYSWDADSGKDKLYAKYWCHDGSGGKYRAYWDWTEIDSINMLYAANGATRCHTELRVKDKVGNYSEILYIDETLNRY